MTLEEAGQVILEDKPYAPCATCIHWSQSGRRTLNTNCPNCKAWGRVPNPEHIKACRVLGIAPPLPLAEAEELKLIEYMKSKPEFYGEQLKILDGMKRR